MNSIQLKVPVIVGLLLLIVLVLVGLLEIIGSSETGRDSEKPLFILTGPRRGGAGFVGEFFNHHSEIFYSFEPASLIREPCDTAENMELRSLIIDDYFNCRIPDFEQEYSDLSFTGNFVEKNYLFRSKIRKLCQEPYCPGTPIQSHWDVGKCRNECPIVNNIKMKKDCSRNVVAIKATNICNFSVLIPVLQRNPNLLIFYIVRDPRAIFNSIKNIGTMRIDDDLLTQISDICAELTSVLFYLESLPVEMKNRIEIIRFEDIWENPNQFSQVILEQAKLLQQDRILDEYLYDQFSRNQRQLDEWRWVLTWSNIEQIQSSCSPIMQPFGYLPLDHPESTKSNHITRSTCPLCRLEF